MNCTSPPYSSGTTLFGDQLLLDALRIRVGLVDLVDRDDERHVARLRVRDRFLRLRHDAVVGRDDQHDDVGDLRAARAHRRERLVARRVEERDHALRRLDVVGADVLRDAAGLAARDARAADRVEQRRLAVVDVAHDRDHRRPRQRDDVAFALVSASSASGSSSLAAVALWPISSTTIIAVSWSSTWLIVTIVPIFISTLMSSAAFTDILCARSATLIVSGTVTSRTSGPAPPASTPASSSWR